jgi:hypothetical protein
MYYNASLALMGVDKGTSCDVEVGRDRKTVGNGFWMAAADAASYRALVLAQRISC